MSDKVECFDNGIETELANIIGEPINADGSRRAAKKLIELNVVIARRDLPKVTLRRDGYLIADGRCCHPRIDPNNLRQSAFSNLAFAEHIEAMRAESPKVTSQVDRVALVLYKDDHWNKPTDWPLGPFQDDMTLDEFKAPYINLAREVIAAVRVTDKETRL